MKHQAELSRIALAATLMDATGHVNAAASPQDHYRDRRRADTQGHVALN
jgi:hypothetical protein